MKTAILISYMWLAVAVICLLLTSVKGLFFLFPAIVSYILHRLVKDAIIRLTQSEEE